MEIRPKISLTNFVYIADSKLQHIEMEREKKLSDNNLVAQQFLCEISEVYVNKSKLSKILAETVLQ